MKSPSASGLSLLHGTPSPAPGPAKPPVSPFAKGGRECPVSSIAEGDQRGFPFEYCFRRVRLAAVCLLLAAAAPLRAAGPTDEVLARLAQGAAGIETAQGRVRQEKRLEMFKDTVVSRGRFAYRRPDRLRWELTDPVVTGFVLTGSSGRRWHGLTGKTEAFTLANDPMMRVVATQILASVRADFSPLQKEYRISVSSESPVTLQLEPLSPNPFVERVTVTFSKGGEHVESVAVHEKGGDQTTISFTEVEVNRPLPDGTF